MTGARDDQGKSIASVRDMRWMLVSKWACFVFAAFLPVLIYGTLQVRFSTAAIAQWLPSDGDERERYSEFLELFEDDLFLVVSWPGCDLDNPTVTKVVDAMREDAANSDNPIVHRIWSSQEVVNQLIEGPGKLDRNVAIERLRGFLIGNRGTGAIVLSLLCQLQYDGTSAPISN